MKRKLNLLFFLCFCASLANSQTRKVTGLVLSDSTKQPLSAVTVAMQGGQAKTATDAEGRFTINVPEKAKVVLVFTSIGYSSQEVNVGQKSDINVSLASSSDALNEVVVIGYQAVRK